MKIVRYEARYWPALRRFLATHWRADHPLTRRRLFDWQYAGDDPERCGASRLMLDGQRIVAFLGVIPGAYRFDQQRVDGAALALWLVHPALRSRGLGVFLLRDVETEFALTLCLGINPSVVPIYQRSGYAYATSLRRWVVALQPETATLFRAGWPSGFASGETPANCAFAEGGAPIAPQRVIDARGLALAWQLLLESGAAPTIALARGESFWRWRYTESRGFRYRQFGDASRSAALIARVEKIVAPATPALDRREVLRVIEIVPARADVWRGEMCGETTALLRGVLAWARRRGVLLADFQCSHGLFGATLQSAGFVEQRADAAQATFPRVFQPLRYDVPPINFAWRVREDLAGGAAWRDPDQLHLLKSDGDMDRPNLPPRVAATTIPELRPPHGVARSGETTTC